ncbi:MAG TPA: hypothetical protein VJ735_20160 [Actinomycetes bacterium]|nr:hypothetical protein [Actinomycetes bacterium]
MNMNLTHRVITKRLKVDGTNYTGAANTTDLTSEAVDTQNADAVRFICGFGTITAGAVTSTKVRQGQQSNMSDGADLAGTAQTVADTDDNKIVITEIHRPQERYVDHVVDRGTQNAVIDFLIVELLFLRKFPVTQDAATVVGSAEVHNSPAEGTA